MESDNSSGGRPACPICGRPGTARYRPFCSAHCANVDLSRWLKGVYAVSTEEAPVPENAHAMEASDAED